MDAQHKAYKCGCIYLIGGRMICCLEHTLFLLKFKEERRCQRVGCENVIPKLAAKYCGKKCRHSANNRAAYLRNVENGTEPRKRKNKEKTK